MVFVPILECLGLGWLEIFAVVWLARFWLLVELCPRFDQLAVSHAVVLGSLAAGGVLECGLAFFCVFSWFFKCSGCDVTFWCGIVWRESRSLLGPNMVNSGSNSWCNIPSDGSFILNVDHL